MRRIASVLLVLVAAAAVVALTGARSPREQKGVRFKIAFDNAFGLTEGGDLRVGGVRAGKTLSFSLSDGKECQGRTPGDGPPRVCAVVNAIITENGFEKFKTDAHCDIRQQSLIGEYYVDCQPGLNKTPLGNNSVIPDTQTTSTIPPDLVADVMRRPYRDRLRLIIAELGTGLAGRPQDVAELLQRADPGLRETRKVLQILGNQRTIIKNFISNSNTVVRELDQRKHDLEDWIVQAGRASEVSASRASDISAGFQRLPTFLDELRGTMARLENLTDAQTPLLHNLQAAAPPLNTFLQRLGPFSQASLPAIRSLGNTGEVGIKAFRASAEDIRVLNQLAKNAPSAAKPLRQLLQTLDNRDRAIESTNTDVPPLAPPAPDPTAISRSKKHKKGYTGFEAIWNYFYWQTLSLNEFDSVSHVLRAVGIDDPVCGQYQNDFRPPSRGGSVAQDRARRRCNSYLGPNQPGITTPDPTDNAAALARTPAKKLGERRGPGQPEAGPLPGQIDYSKPHPTLPPSARELLNHLSGNAGGGKRKPRKPSVPQVPALPSTGAPGADASGSVSQALDYLLGP